MSDDAKDNNMEDESPDFHNTSKLAFSQNMELLQKDLDLLYLKGNASARNKFGDIHPDIAKYIFSEDLIQYDYEGCDDLERRSQLEEEALQRRFEILQVMDELEDKSIEAGSLKMDYVGKVIDHFGVGVCRYMYAENIIERVRPGLLKAADEEKDKDKDKEDGDRQQNHISKQENLNDDNILMAAEQEILASKPKDTAVPLPTLDDDEKETKSSGPAAVNIEDELGDIKPIDMRNAKEGAQSLDNVSETVKRQNIEIGGSEEQAHTESPAASITAEDLHQVPPLSADIHKEQTKETEGDTPNPAPPLEPEKVPDTNKSSLGPPLKNEENKEASSIFGKKPDFMNIKVTGEPDPKEKSQISYQELFNTLATKTT